MKAFRGCGNRLTISVLRLFVHLYGISHILLRGCTFSGQLLRRSEVDVNMLRGKFSCICISIL